MMRSTTTAAAALAIALVLAASASAVPLCVTDGITTGAISTAAADLTAGNTNSLIITNVAADTGVSTTYSDNDPVNIVAGVTATNCPTLDTVVAHNRRLLSDYSGGCLSNCAAAKIWCVSVSALPAADAAAAFTCTPGEFTCDRGTTNIVATTGTCAGNVARTDDTNAVCGLIQTTAAGAINDALKGSPYTAGSAANAFSYVILAGAGITTSSTVPSPTYMRGNTLGATIPPSLIGSYPTVSITGAYSRVGGPLASQAIPMSADDIQGGTAAALTAQGTLTAAYNTAAGLDSAGECAMTVDGNLGGLTLYPGLYKSTTGLWVDGSPLFLQDTTTGQTGIFIFQTPTFMMTTGMHIILHNSAGLASAQVNSAQAKNIFWQVASSANLLGSTKFFGTMMADQGITSGWQAVVDGRLLARIASVTTIEADFKLPDV